jgi:HK97 family phage prohead protease
MPWKIQNDDGRFCVHKENPDGSVGETVACHDTEDDAKAQLAALYASEEDAPDKSVPTEAVPVNFHMTLAKSWPDPTDGDVLYIEGYANMATADRVNDLIEPKAFQDGLTEYMRNPIVLHNHDLDRPVGKTVDANVDAMGLRVRVAIDKSLEWGAKVAKMIERGILNAFSVRARGDKALGYLQPDGVKRIVRWDLQEISVVTVPAHQQALFSVAKALRDGTDLKDAGAQPAMEDAMTVDTEAIAAEVMAKITQPDPSAIAAQVLEAIEAKQLAQRQAEDKAKQEREALRAELLAEIAGQTPKAAPTVPPFPVADLGSGAGAEAMGKLSQIIVGSKFDRVADMDLVKDYYLASRMARAGVAPEPSERFRRAAMTRAAKFMQARDRVVRWPTAPGSQRYYEDVPAFDPVIAQPYVAGAEDVGDVMDASGKVLAKQVKFSDNVTAKGLAQLLEIGAKSNEVIYSTQASYGDEWVPTLMSAMLWRTVRLNAAVLGTLDQFDMPSQPYDWPTESADPTFYKVAETTDESQLVLGATPTADSKIGTAKVTFSAGKLGALSYWSEEQVEDSILNVQGAFRDQYGVAFAQAIEELLISGDETTDNTNISDTGNAGISAAWRLLVLDGLRHQPLVVTTTDARDGGALTIEDLNATRLLMGTRGVFGADPSQLVLITDIPTALKFEDLSEVMTIDKYGPQATILTGELGRIKGIPIIKSQMYGLTDTSGKIHNTAGNNTKGSFMLVNRSGVRVGWRRRPRIFVGQVPFSDAWYIIASARLDIQFKEAGMVGLSYNITV